MLLSLPRSSTERGLFALWVAAFFIFLFAPLLVVIAFAFNAAPFPSLPWTGFTWDWFFGTGPRIGVFSDAALLRSIGTSLRVAVMVTVLTVVLGLCNAFLIERCQFPGRSALYIMMLWPLVIPGVILGVSILLFFSMIAGWAQDLGWRLTFLRPGLTLVVLGQSAFIATITTLIILARLRRFDHSLEEAALNLGATRLGAIWTVTLPTIRPAIIGAAIIAFLMSFENFNTTLILVGSDAPLTIQMYSQIRQGSTPAINAVSVLLMVSSAFLALILVFAERRSTRKSV
ncbi:MAG: ABC transporter permease subunit [Alphaproteobacteria bacterium]